MAKFEKLLKFSKKFTEVKKILLASLAAVVLSGLVFQNCSNPATPNNASLASLGATINFPYDSQIDQIAYMSCNQMNSGTYDPSAYFSFRVGAYRTGSGVAVTPAFMSNKNVAGARTADQAAILSQVPSTLGARPQLAVRAFSNFQIPFLVSATSSGTEGQDYTSFFISMDDPDFAMAVLTSQPGDGVRYLRTEMPQGARFESNISLNNSWATVTSLQNQVNAGSALLALTYVGAAGKYQARAPADYGLSTTATGTSVFGRGYQLQFRQPLGSSGGYPISTLSGVSEINLETRGLPSRTGVWTCDPAMQFRILRSNLTADLSQAGCSLSVDNPADTKLSIVRNSFRVEDWYVDMVNHCLIPKKTGAGCYNVTTGIPANTPATPPGSSTYANDFLNYNIAAPAFPPGQKNNLFVEFGSICYR